MKQKSSIGEKLPIDYAYLKTNVHEINLNLLKCDLYPALRMKVDEHGEIKPYATARSEKKLVELPQLVDVKGNLIYPQNLYLTYSARNRQSTTTNSQALLMFTRWLQIVNKSYRDVFADPEEGVAWLFARLLARSIRKEVYEEREKMELSTAKTYMRAVVNFYKWLNREGVLRWSDEMKPFNFIYKRIPRSRDRGEVDMLSHTKRNQEIIVQSATVMEIFPKGVRLQPHKKLKPLPDDALSILESEINKKSFQIRDRLMIKLGYKGGLRVEEVVSLNEGAIHQPRLGEKECELSLLTSNGVDLKGDVSRTTIIPATLMSELFDYKTSKERYCILADLPIESDSKTAIEPRLFLSSRTKAGAIKKNTLQSCWSVLRKLIRKEHKDWYYKFHDLRSTFATNWLLKVTKEGDLPVDFYFSELKSLLGHSEGTDTMVYIDYHKDRSLGKAAANRRNKESQEAMNNNG